MIMQSLQYSDDTFNSKVWQELEDSSLLSPLMNNTIPNCSHYTCYLLVEDFAWRSINSSDVVVNNVLLDLIKVILEKYKNISEEILHTDHSLANNIFLQFQSIYEHLMYKSTALTLPCRHKLSSGFVAISRLASW